jgi:hypothetical protein
MLTLPLECEVFENEVPDGLETLVRRDGAPEGTIERTVIVMQTNDPGCPEAASRGRVHAHILSAFEGGRVH